MLFALLDLADDSDPPTTDQLHDAIGKALRPLDYKCRAVMNKKQLLQYLRGVREILRSCHAIPSNEIAVPVDQS